jgi:hypothetical protein
MVFILGYKILSILDKDFIKLIFCLIIFTLFVGSNEKKGLALFVKVKNYASYHKCPMP